MKKDRPQNTARQTSRGGKGAPAVIFPPPLSLSHYLSSVFPSINPPHLHLLHFPLHPWDMELPGSATGSRGLCTGASAQRKDWLKGAPLSLHCTGMMSGSQGGWMGPRGRQRRRRCWHGEEGWKGTKESPHAKQQWDQLFPSLFEAPFHLIMAV